ncbi:MAG: hypothetical protein U9Q82_02725, partial [Chloroflexota bacterium]|nr:hypothetical protein [Chloroflexota bacterium]
IIGGVKGAYRRFELDYWGLSYPEAADYLNRVAPPDSKVWVAGPAHLLPLRKDLTSFSDYDKEIQAQDYDYVVATTRNNYDLLTYPHAEVIHEIKRDGAVLTVIKGPTHP